jgi:predicted phage-related endonuclease
MSITIHPDMIQGSDEWLAARCGMLTASEMKLIITPSTLKPAKNDKASAHLYELLAQRITGYVEPHYISEDMLRGQMDEVDARALYAQHYAPVQEVGFITNSEWGFTIGYSPDGLVGDDGLIECKSRRQKFQVETIISGAVPDEHVIQTQTAFLVTGRKWLDYVSYCGGMHLVVARTYPDQTIMSAILDAASAFEKALQDKRNAYDTALATMPKLIPTERRVEQEMFV